LEGEKALPPPNAPPGKEGTAEPDAQKKKGFFGKIVGIFKEEKPSNPPSPPPPPAEEKSPH
jgi:hypothetical protein